MAKTKERQVKKNSGKSPSFQFYYKDWLADTKLRGVSKVIKGTWIDIICISCDMPKPGVFADENGPISEENLLQMLDGNRRENRRAFEYIKSRHIIKRDASGAFYVKRIKEDMELRRIRQEAGKKGGNPNLVGVVVNQTPKQNPTPSARKKKMKKKKERVVGKENNGMVKQDSPPDKGSPEEWEVIRRGPEAWQKYKEAQKCAT